MTQQEAEYIASQIPIEEGDLIVCPQCNELHDAQVVSRNSSGPKMSIMCGDKIIVL